MQLSHQNDCFRGWKIDELNSQGACHAFGSPIRMTLWVTVSRYETTKTRAILRIWWNSKQNWYCRKKKVVTLLLGLLAKLLSIIFVSKSSFTEMIVFPNQQSIIQLAITKTSIQNFKSTSAAHCVLIIPTRKKRRKIQVHRDTKKIP